MPLSRGDFELANPIELTTIQGEKVTFHQALKRKDQAGDWEDVLSTRHEVQRKEIARVVGEEGLFSLANFDVIRSDELAKQPANLPAMWPHERYRLYLVGDGTGRGPESITGKPLFGDSVLLFNVFVALEWEPSRETLARISTGATAASNFLYEATDGQMAVGQVTIGGPEFMQAADIQIMASTRFLPRSWMNGLNDEGKFSPIRLGRGLWSKNRSAVIFWDAPEGYRTIIHEWGHYALNLLDQYVSDLGVAGDQRDPRVLRASKAGVTPAHVLFVPYISPPVESIMSTLEGTSKIMPNLLAKVKNQLKKRFPEVNLIVPPTPGPYQLPLSLPVFFGAPSLKVEEKRQVPPVAPWGNEATISSDMLARGGVRENHCWVYILRFTRERDRDNLERVIPQGIASGSRWRAPD